MKTTVFDEIARGVATDLRDACLVCIVEGQVLACKSLFRSLEPLAGYLQNLAPFRYHLGERIPGRVWQSEAPILIPEVDQVGIVEGARPEVVPYIALGVQSMMAVPVRVASSVVGVIIVTRNEKKNPFDEEDLKRLEAWAERLGRHLAPSPHEELTPLPR